MEFEPCVLLFGSMVSWTGSSSILGSKREKKGLTSERRGSFAALRLSGRSTASLGVSFPFWADCFTRENDERCFFLLIYSWGLGYSWQLDKLGCWNQYCLSLVHHLGLIRNIVWW